MNADQIVKLAAFQANAIKQAGTLAPFFTVAELYAWLNDANYELEKTIRNVFDDYFARTLVSTDTTPQKILGIDYTPTSLQLPAGTSTVTLPPDLETIRTIRCVTPGYESMVFEARDIGHESFQDLQRVSSTTTIAPGGRIYYDVIGERTLVIAPLLSTAVDISLTYIARTKPLVRYAAGTVTITDGSTSVAGSGTTWLSGTPFDASYLDLMVPVTSPTTLTNVDVSWAYDGTYRNRVASIASNTALTLASSKVGAETNASYVLSSVPVIPPEHHPALADYVTAQMLGKAGNQNGLQYFLGKFERRKALVLNTISLRQPDVEYTEDYSIL